MVEAELPSLPANVAYPKRRPNSPGYWYYAGYSRAFVRDILAEWPRHQAILDPWNGSGATTTVAAELGLRCTGIDLNPAMVVIARAALLSQNDVATIRRQADLLNHAPRKVTAVREEDPLLEWLGRRSVARLRALQDFLVGSSSLQAPEVANLDAAQSFWLMILFQSVRRPQSHGGPPTQPGSSRGVSRSRSVCDGTNS